MQTQASEMRPRRASVFLGCPPSLTVEKAKALAIMAHRRQTRKFTGAAYIIHPLLVARMIARTTGDASMTAAALLHDVVEDTILELEDIERYCGHTVAELVGELTCTLTPEDGNRRQRKAMERERLSRASPQAATIKYADIMDNIRDIVMVAPRFAETYLPEQRMLLEVMNQGQRDLRSQAMNMVIAEQAKLDARNALVA